MHELRLVADAELLGQQDALDANARAWMAELAAGRVSVELAVVDQLAARHKLVELRVVGAIQIAAQHGRMIGGHGEQLDAFVDHARLLVGHSVQVGEQQLHLGELAVTALRIEQDVGGGDAQHFRRCVSLTLTGDAVLGFDA